MKEVLKSEFANIEAEIKRIKLLMDEAFEKNPNSKEFSSYQDEWKNLNKMKTVFRENNPGFFLNNFENNMS